MLIHPTQHDLKENFQLALWVYKGTFLATCLARSLALVDKKQRGLARLVHWLMSQNVATQVAGNI